MTKSKAALARQLGVSRSSLYYKPKQLDKDEALRLRIEDVMQNNPGYGHRRLAIALGMNKKRIRRVMKLFKLKPARRCRTPSKPLDQGLAATNYPDITRVLSPYSPNFLWVSDFSFISYRGNFIYLATVMDLFTKEVIGVAIRNHHRVELVIAAFEDAAQKRKSLPVWVHSDQGNEYRAEQMAIILGESGVKISMSPKSSPWRNGSQESFFGRFKTEFGDPDRFATLEELVAAIYAYIAYYNNARIHSRVRMPPATFYQQWLENHSQLLPGYPQVISLPLGEPPRRSPFGARKEETTTELSV